ncbi:hypothetical protein GCM10027190_22430 [Spirosoma areae]
MGVTEVIEQEQLAIETKKLAPIGLGQQSVWRNLPLRYAQTTYVGRTTYYLMGQSGNLFTGRYFLTYIQVQKN